MFRKVLLAVLVVSMFLGASYVYMGCSSSDSVAPAAKQNDDIGSSEKSPALPHTITQQALLELEEIEPILQANLATTDVAAARTWLESAGYSFVDTNSLVLIETESIANTPMASDVQPRPLPTPKTLRSDTVAWLAFENPTHDAANHTALLTASGSDSQAHTVLIELNVGVVPPQIIREGFIVEGQFIPDSTGALDWLVCMASGLGGSATVCLLSNCGWAGCTAIGGAGTLVACTISWLLS